MLIVVTGGSGSGKSEYAENLACKLAGDAKKYYIATMQPYGTEGQKRIMRHHKLRAGKGFETIEQYQQVAQALQEKEGTFTKQATVLMECLSNLLANELFEEGGQPDSVMQDCLTLYRQCKHLIIVTNEVFEDGCQYPEETLEYIRRLGALNTGLAARADIVVEVVYSIPVFWKGEKQCID